MARKPLVSVVMPVLNPHPVYFQQAVESILNQTMDDWELVIVEDPSPAPTPSFLKDYPDPRIRYFRNPKRTSLVRQRNQALQEARAELIACHDHDDISEPDRLAKQVAFLERHSDIAVVGTWLRVIDEAGRTLGYRCYPCDHADIVRAMPLYNPIGQPSVMFRRSIVLRCGGYRYEQFPAVEDYDLWCRMVKKGAQFANLPEALVCYRVHRGAMKSAKLRGILKGTMAVKKMHWQAEMGWRARTRLFMEHFLLVLPPQWVMALFLKTQIRPLPLDRSSRAPG